jgi:hypothetical protein
MDSVLNAVVAVAGTAVGLDRNVSVPAQFPNQANAPDASTDANCAFPAANS